VRKNEALIYELAAEAVRFILHVRKFGVKVPSDRRLSAKLVSTVADTGCHVVSMTDPYGCILGFLDWSHYFCIQVVPQLYS
jgi:hypothetical protein